jgi:hypothetical protein
MSELDKTFMKIDEEAYDKAVQIIRQELGSYHHISNALYACTGSHISYNTVRNQFLAREIPIEYAAAYQDLTEGKVTVFDFFPWLRTYL